MNTISIIHSPEINCIGALTGLIVCAWLESHLECSLCSIYIHLVEARKLMQTVTVWIASTPKSRNKYFEVPFNVSAYFTGGDDVLYELREKCLPLEEVSAQKQQRRFILYGLGGSGKTQMALKFASYHQERYDYVAA